MFLASQFVDYSGNNKFGDVMKKLISVFAVGCLLNLPAHAVLIGNFDGAVDFPDGAISFADSVVDYVPGDTLHPLTSDPTNALGLPDATFPALLDCIALVACPFVSLGTGGTLIVEFIDNFLTGSGDDGDDLYIFETGPLVQATFVDISADGLTWDSVGSVGGSLRGIDIDAFGFGVGDLFSFVRLTDSGIPEDGESPQVLGADIDAIGAISTVAAVSVPEPTTLSLLAAGLLGVFASRRRRVFH